MINLNQEREKFEEFFSGDYEYVFGECFNEAEGYFYEGKHDKSAYFAFEAWKKRAEQENAEITTLKQQLEKLESGEFVLVPKRVNQKMLLAAVQAMFGEFNERNLSGQGAYSDDIASLANEFANHQLSNVWRAMIEAAQENGDE